MSADLYGAVAEFLAGDAGDVFAVVNLAAGSPPGPALMQPGTVYVSRPDASLESREAALPTVHKFPRIEVRSVAAGADRVSGIGWADRDAVFDLTAIARRDALDLGVTQIATLELITRAIRTRYSDVTNLAIAPSGATLLRASAGVTRMDEAPGSPELARATVRVTFTFLEAQADNT